MSQRVGDQRSPHPDRPDGDRAAGRNRPTGARPGRLSPTPIWLHPVVLMGFGTALQFWWMDHANWNWPHVAAALVGGAAFWFAASRASAPETGPSPGETALIERTVRVVGRLMAFGYAIWLVIGVARGLSPGHITGFFLLDGETNEYLKAVVFRPSILSTFFVNLTVVYFGLAGTLTFKAGGGGTRRERIGRLRSVPYFRALFLITVVRGVLVSERLVVLEMVVALVAAYFVGTPRARRVGVENRRWRRLRRRTPALLLVGTLLFFGLAEIPRSFAGKRAEGEVASPVEYSADRLVAYYGTAGDNGAMSLEQVAPIWDDGLYLSVPVLTALLGNEQEVMDRWFALLDRFYTREFNNTGGWTSVLVDFGVPLGLVVLAGTLFLLGHWWVIAMKRPASLAVLAPIVILATLELPRIFYLGQTRAVLALTIAAYLHNAVKPSRASRLPAAVR